MPIRFRCPMCGGMLSIARRKAGSEVICPKCEYEVMVPESDEAPAEEELELAPEPEPRSPTRLKTQNRPLATAPKADAPLFEREDIEALLAPAKLPEPIPTPTPVVEPLLDHGITISYGVAVMLGVLVLVLLAMAFVTGYLVGR